ncbi:MAG: response regulator transcription factor [Chloroflexota bacterium]
MVLPAKPPQVLVVDDEPQIRRLLTVSLTHHGFQIDAVGSAEEAILRVSERAYDIVLLDLGLPDLDGRDVCTRIREWSQVPVIVVSVRDDERGKVEALNAGADDYVTKPFGIEELLARMRAHMRRVVTTPEGPALTFGALTIDLAQRTVVRGGEPVHLTPTEYDLLRALSLHAGRVMTHRQLLREARGPAYESETPLLRVHMVGLRRKLGLAPFECGYISTEPGIGYRLQSESRISQS